MYDITLVIPSIRSHEWRMRLYNSILANANIQFLFIGTEHDKSIMMPPNARFVYATVKRVQCYAIGVELSESPLFCFVADDVEFTPYAFDFALDTYNELNTYRAIIGFRYVLNGVDYTNAHINGDRLGKVIPPGPAIMSKRFYEEIGGLDSIYITHNPERELFLRAHLNGGRLAYTEGAMLEYASDDNPNNQWMPKHDVEVSLARTNALYFENKEVPRYPFIFDDTIYTQNQGHYEERTKKFTTTTECPSSTVGNSIRMYS